MESISERIIQDALHDEIKELGSELEELRKERDHFKQGFVLALLAIRELVRDGELRERVLESFEGMV